MKNGTFALNLLLFFTLVRACVDFYIWVYGGAHHNLLLFLTFTLILFCIYRSEKRNIWLALLILMSVYRSFLNLIIIIPDIGVIFESNRIYFFKILIIFLPAVLSLLVIFDWKKLDWLVGSSTFKGVIGGRRFITAIVVVPALLPIFVDVYWFLLLGMQALLFLLLTVIVVWLRWLRLALFLPFFSFLFEGFVVANFRIDSSSILSTFYTIWYIFCE